MGKVVAAVARPRRTAGKLKKEPKSKLNKLGLAKAMECICKRTKRRRQTLKKCVNILYIILCKLTVFENHPNCLIFQLFASEASYVYILSGQNGPFWGSFSKPEACGQIVLPDRSLLIGQKMVENAKIEKFVN